MNVTVADCLKLPTLREAQLIAGAKGTDRAVSSVSVLEWPETKLLSNELIIGNELIISALVTIKDDVARQCSVLRHLRNMGAAGLVLFYVGVFIPRIDEALIAVADEINLPLIAMPLGRMDFRYSDMITDIVEYMVYIFHISVTSVSVTVTLPVFSSMVVSVTVVVRGSSVLVKV